MLFTAKAAVSWVDADTHPPGIRGLLVEELKAHAQAENCTPAQSALAWLLAQKPFVVPIPSANASHGLSTGTGRRAAQHAAVSG
jgi:diketogulonate reductase-like aldo/keto reductase